MMYAMFSAMMLKGLDAKAFVDELRERMREELDYELEARNVARVRGTVAGHPWVRVPRLVPELSTSRVLTTEWVDGMSFDEFRRTAAARHQAARRRGRSGGSPSTPCCGTARSTATPTRATTSSTTTAASRSSTSASSSAGRPASGSAGPTLDAIVVHRDPELLVAAMEAAGFLRRGHGLDAEPSTTTSAARTRRTSPTSSRSRREWMRDTIGKIFDVQGPHSRVIEQLNMPAERS